MAVMVFLSVEATRDLVNLAGDEAEAVYVPWTGQKMVAESSSPSLPPFGFSR